MSQVNTRLANRILIGLVVGAVLGVLTLLVAEWIPGILPPANWVAVQICDPLGQTFLRLLFFVVIPLVFASLTNGVLQLGDPRRLGGLAARTFSLFFLNMAIAVAIGLCIMQFLDPGRYIDVSTREQLVSAYGGAAQTHITNSKSATGLSANYLVEMFLPRNLLGAFVGNNRNTLGEVLPLILFAILIGAAALRLEPARRVGLQAALDTIVELMTTIVGFALRLAPYAVPAMIYSIVVKTGFEVLVALAVFTLGCIIAMLLHLFGTMSIWLRFLAHRNPIEFFGRIKHVLVTAFSTSSSSATLPAALSAAREQLGISSSTAGFVLPLGTTLNMSGTALYEGCVVLFVASVFGIDLTLSQQMILLFLAVMSAVAVAAIPGGSLPLIAGLLVNFGVPPEGIGIILGADRILDMTRTMVNVGSDMVTCAVVDVGQKDAAASDDWEVNDTAGVGEKS